MAIVLAVSPLWAAGFEIADLTQAGLDDFRGYTRVYIDYGENPMTAEEWDEYTPSPGYLKNTPRNAEFNEENTFSSPGMPTPDVQITTIDGYTWKFIAQTQSAMWIYNSELFPDTLNAYEAAFATVTPPAGVIKFSSNEKNQEMIFWARAGNDPEETQIKRYYITDEWGNKYILGASGAPDDTNLDYYVDLAVLPEGWTKSSGFLDENLSLLPAYGRGDQAHFNLFRDSGDNTYFQLEWGETGNSIAAQIESMPIWGGSTNDVILGRAGDDNLIHGAGGDDIIFALGNNDIIYGDAGIDTVVFQGLYSEYSILSWADGGATMSLFGFGFTKHLYDVEYLQFDNLTLSTSSIPEPRAALLLGVGVVALLFLRRRSCDSS